MNKCVLVGNLTRDPEHTTTANGISVCRFSIAVNRNYTSSSGEREADFINIVAWRGLADNCGKYLVKGNKVAVSGSIQTRNYEDKDGNKRYATEVVADDVEFLTPKGEGASAGPRTPSASGSKPVMELEPVDDSELPF